MIYKFNGRQVRGAAAVGVGLFVLAYFTVVCLVIAALGYAAWEVLFGGLLG